MNFSGFGAVPTIVPTTYVRLFATDGSNSCYPLAMIICSAFLSGQLLRVHSLVAAAVVAISLSTSANAQRGDAPRPAIVELGAWNFFRDLDQCQLTLTVRSASVMFEVQVDGDVRWRIVVNDLRPSGAQRPAGRPSAIRFMSPADQAAIPLTWRQSRDARDTPRASGDLTPDQGRHLWEQLRSHGGSVVFADSSRG